MDSFQKIQVTSAGLPKLMEGEATFVLEPGVQIKSGDKERSFHFNPPGKGLVNGEEMNSTEVLPGDGSTVQVTSHGIVWHSGQTAYRLPLSRVERVETSAKGFFAKSYVTFVTLNPPMWQCQACTLLNEARAEKCAACGTPYSNAGASHAELNEPMAVKLSSPTGDTRKLTAGIEESMKKRTWEKKSSLGKGGAGPSGGSKGAQAVRMGGIAGLRKRQDIKQKEHAKFTKDAFSDLETLMDMAHDMVKLTDRYSEVAKLKLKQGESGKSSDDSTQFVSILTTMGISNPVTKEIAGSMFTEQLARQLYGFFEQRLRDTPGNMIQLTDVYCMYNRARGTALISPEDLYSACLLFEPLKLNARLRKLDSGVLVIQPLELDDQRAAEKILELIANNGKAHITTAEFSFHLGTPFVLAQGQLEAAEKIQSVCRDETMEGTQWYSTEPFETGAWEG